MLLIICSFRGCADAIIGIEAEGLELADKMAIEIVMRRRLLLELIAFKN